MKKILFIILIVMLSVVSFGNDSQIKRALVKIYSAHQMYNFNSPWQFGESFNSTSTGFIVEGNRIITNAHSVLNGRFLQIRKEGDSKKYKALVKYISEDYDLAMVEVEDKTFFSGTTQLKLGALPEIQDRLTVYGYPLGGDKLSTTQGIVSRMEHNNYTLTNRRYLIGQTDAAINSGNSGGPVISKGRVAGVAFAGIPTADNIGYFIPVNILSNFLEDVKDNNYDGAPRLGIMWNALESNSHRKMLGIENNSKGVLIKKIYKNSPFEGVLQKDDVLMKLDGKTIEYDGTVEFRKNEKTDFSFINQQKKYGDTITYEIVRNKKTLTGSVKLENKKIPLSVVTDTRIETPPSYIVYGGLLFEPLTSQYITLSGLTAPTLASIYEKEDLYNEYEELVILVRVLPFDVNLGYSTLDNKVVTKINNQKYNNFKDFVNKIKQTKTEFIVFELDNGYEIVLDTKEVAEQREALLSNYNITSEMSDDVK